MTGLASPVPTDGSSSSSSPWSTSSPPAAMRRHWAVLPSPYRWLIPHYSSSSSSSPSSAAMCMGLGWPTQPLQMANHRHRRYPQQCAWTELASPAPYRCLYHHRRHHHHRHHHRHGCHTVIITIVIWNNVQGLGWQAKSLKMARHYHDHHHHRGRLHLQ